MNQDLTYRAMRLGVSKKEATKARIIGDIAVDRRPLLQQGFKPSEIVDDWNTIFDPAGILNAPNSPVIIDTDHDHKNTGADFVKYWQAEADIFLKSNEYQLPSVKAEVLVENGNGTNMDLLQVVKDNKTYGWSLGASPKTISYYDENWNNITQQYIEFAKSQGYVNPTHALNNIKKLSPIWGREVYAVIDTWYLRWLSVLTKHLQGAYDASFDSITLERMSPPLDNQNNTTNITHNMPNTDKETVQRYIHQMINNDGQIGIVFEENEVSDGDDVTVTSKVMYEDGTEDSFTYSMQDEDRPFEYSSPAEYILSKFKGVTERKEDEKDPMATMRVVVAEEIEKRMGAYEERMKKLEERKSDHKGETKRSEAEELEAIRKAKDTKDAELERSESKTEKGEEGDNTEVKRQEINLDTKKEENHKVVVKEVKRSQAQEVFERTYQASLA